MAFHLYRVVFHQHSVRVPPKKYVTLQIISEKMNNFTKNYGPTLALLLGLIAGGCLGVLAPDSAHSVKPIGDFFLNLLFVLVVPMVFFSISVSICNMKKRGDVGRLFGTTLLVFLAMSIIASVIAYIGTRIYSPLGNVAAESLEIELSQQSTLADAVVSSLTVTDFPLLFSKSSLLPLIIISALMGWSIASLGEKAEVLEKIINAGNAVTMKMMNAVMFIAPIGLGCFFAYTVAETGNQLLEGYLRSFILYMGLTAFYFFIVNPLYVLLSHGKNGFKLYWMHILPPSIIAFATCSSSLAIPGNIEALKKMGADADLSEMIIPFGTNVHKDGSVMSGLLKTVFLMLLAGQSISTPSGMLLALSISIVSSIVIGAVTGGMIVGELLIASLLGLPVEQAGIIIVIGTLVDMPSTLINSNSNVVAALLVDRFTQKKKQLQK